MIRYILPFFILFLIASCKSESNKAIEEFSENVRQFEDQVAQRKPGENTDELMYTANTLSAQIDKLNAMELDEKQEEMLGALSLRLSISVRVLQEDLSKQLNEDIQRQQILTDSIEPLQADTI